MFSVDALMPVYSTSLNYQNNFHLELKTSWPKHISLKAFSALKGVGELHENGSPHPFFCLPLMEKGYCQYPAILLVQLQVQRKDNRGGDFNYLCKLNCVRQSCD